jgi:hypothetical protein
MALYVVGPLIGAYLWRLRVFIFPGLIRSFFRYRDMSNCGRLYRTNHRLQICLRRLERIVLHSSLDRHPNLEGNLRPSHSIETGEVFGSRESGSDPYSQKRIHLARAGAQSQSPCDVTYPQLHLLHSKSIPCTVSIYRVFRLRCL